MNGDYRAVLQMTWDLVLRQARLLQLMVPACHDMAQTLIEGRQPTPEQVSAWTKLSPQVTQAMLEVSAGIEKARVVVDPMIRYDA